MSQSTTVTVKLFAVYQEAFDVSELELDFPMVHQFKLSVIT
jgi:molybdopterin synthase sulfur carrier subunit